MRLWWILFREVNVATTLLTGGHTGIGFECAKELASHAQCDLVLAGRSIDKLEIAAQQIRSIYGARVKTLELDTSSLNSVRRAASTFRTMLGSGEIRSFETLLCNAGGFFAGPLSYSEDGYELTFATNCLGHFLLIELLADCMADNSRIVFTASGTHDPETVDGKMVGAVAKPDAIRLANEGRGKGVALSAGKRYSTSKLCTMLYAYELHRRLRRNGSSISSIAFDPGAIPETGLLRTVPDLLQKLARTPLVKLLAKQLGVTQGSLQFSGRSLAKLAIDPAYEDVSGKYFQADKGVLSERRSSRLSYDEGQAAKLWADSSSLVRLERDEQSLWLR